MGQELATQRLDIRHGMPQKFNWHFGMVRQCITLKYYDSESPARASINRTSDLTHLKFERPNLVWGYAK